MGFRHFLTHQVEYHVKNVFFVKVFAWYSAGCMYTFSSTLTPLHRIFCIEKHSICELLRRVPSLCLALSIELAFAAHCMHTRITAMSNATKCFVLPSEQSRLLLSAAW